MGNFEQQRRIIVQQREDEDREQRIRMKYIMEQQKRVREQPQNSRRTNPQSFTYNVPSIDNFPGGQKEFIKFGKEGYSKTFDIGA